mmetsp:Transcript_67020/g.138948  ORF Transcript_67020/g.138948 Transcript_67020/m.138948 type:complete len:201 (+) Transcript_67020:191-793(+)
MAAENCSPGEQGLESGLAALNPAACTARVLPSDLAGPGAVPNHGHQWKHRVERPAVASAHRAAKRLCRHVLGLVEDHGPSPNARPGSLPLAASPGVEALPRGGPRTALHPRRLLWPGREHRSHLRDPSEEPARRLRSGGRLPAATVGSCGQASGARHPLHAGGPSPVLRARKPSTAARAVPGSGPPERSKPLWGTGSAWS